MEYLQRRYSDAFVLFIWQLQLLLPGIFNYIAVLKLLSTLGQRMVIAVNWVLSHPLVLDYWELSALVRREEELYFFLPHLIAKSVG